MWIIEVLVSANSAMYSKKKAAILYYFHVLVFVFFNQIFTWDAATISARKSGCWRNFYGFWCYLPKTDSNTVTRQWLSFPTPIQEGVSRWETDCGHNPLPYLNYCCLLPFSKQLIQTCFRHVAQWWAIQGCQFFDHLQVHNFLRSATRCGRSDFHQRTYLHQGRYEQT